MLLSSFNSSGKFGRDYKLYIANCSFGFYRKLDDVCDFGAEFPAEMRRSFGNTAIEHCLMEAEDKIRILTLEIIDNR
jgi:hypothetical protein